ncbi:DASS family sodium-coupled anion symporter [Seongchinamella sediminis]|uniref:DASS family sodium-coupled anion symporter n=1 Tax=Seongchinamella sediminis TaxID=2283635 RepID=A0A3L7DW24_9GAMM|nr:SLC13 family permease [Seongchinamella sediminis]RLQ20810.1 DASS family sodium-coupled anion symporter [Seongchinamella sediminis]
MRNWAIWLGPLAAALAALGFIQGGYSGDIAIVGFVAVLCVIWWVLEPVPIPVTSLLPLAVLPLFGVLTPAEVGQAYGSPLILLLLGGFLLSQAMEHSGAHRRIAIGMVNLFGAHSGLRLVLGFMAAAALLSMWISNTATTLMLLPVVLAVLEASPDKDRLAAPLLLGVAYAASVGGLGTPIGTPPNLIFMQVFEETTGESISFTTWMSWALPVVVLMVPVMALILTRNIRGTLSVSLPRVGAWRTEEKRVMLVFGLTALAWVTRGEPFGGWMAWFDLPQANDASVALLAVVLMFMLPDGKGERLLTWERAVRIPWGVLLLFSGGICLAKGFVSSGLSDLLGGVFTDLATLPIYLLMLLIALTVTFMTETTSNTASTTLLMPVLAAVALSAGLAPETLMVPAAMSASCAFMLPVATAPNSVVYSSGMFTVARMAREGVALNFLGAAVISTICYLQLT